MKTKDKGGEKQFAELLIKANKYFVYQPYLKAFKIRPDFFCIEDNIYYEVINTRQSYYARKDKIDAAIKAGINIKLVRPDGKEYISGEKTDFDNIKVKSLFIKDIPENLGMQIKVIAAQKGITIRDFVIAALEAYLQK